MQSAVALPFLGLVLSIALVPAVAPRWWGRQMGWAAVGWSLALLPFTGASAWLHGLLRAMVDAYLPFIAVTGALYIAGGGISLRGGPGGRPWSNTLLLAFGGLLALVMGPAGAAMTIVHPLLAANAHRRHRFHLALFAILLVGNVASLITPLGNPPLLAGFLRGVPFFWPAQRLVPVWLAASGLLLALFFAIDTWLARKEPPPGRPVRPRVRGGVNAALILILAAATAYPAALVPVGVAVGAVSWWITPRSIRRSNRFSWHPMTEVAILFAGLFVTLEPVSDLLRLGLDGPFAQTAGLVLDADGQARPLALFWVTGLLSAFLDNAPSYLVFFDMTGIRPGATGARDAIALEAISAGAVLFGGLTYIGNAPNLMLRAIASHRGVRMPGFFSYLAWASLVMLPVLLLVSRFFAGD